MNQEGLKRRITGMHRNYIERQRYWKKLYLLVSWRHVGLSNRLNRLIIAIILPSSLHQLSPWGAYTESTLPWKTLVAHGSRATTKISPFLFSDNYVEPKFGKKAWLACVLAISIHVIGTSEGFFFAKLMRKVYHRVWGRLVKTANPLPPSCGQVISVLCPS